MDVPRLASRPAAFRPPAFSELPHIRWAYLITVLGRTYQGQTVQNSNRLLRGILDGYEMQAPLPTVPKPVRTVESAMRRLGIDPDAHITVYAACPVCWRLYTLSELEVLLSPACTFVPACKGELYTSIQLKSSVKRQPNKIVPYVSIIESLKRMMLRPGFANSIQDSRTLVPNKGDDPSFIMQGISDGTAWHTPRTRQRRVFSPDGTFEDINTEQPRAGRRLTSYRYGLHLIINMDWMGITNGRPHSAGPAYVAIADLPRSVVFLQRNIICPYISSGPNEPDSQQMRNLTRPMREEIDKLQQGVDMHAHDEGCEVTVFGDGFCNCCDTPARSKFNGTASHSHKTTPCPWCECTADQINEVQGYTDLGYPKTTDAGLLRRAYDWLHARSKTAAEKLFKSFGARWTAFSDCPGYLPRSGQILDFMHAFYLGNTSHYFLDVLVHGYMFCKVGGINSPLKRFEAALNAIRWPSHIGRLPKNLGENQSLKKADEWRRLLSSLPVLLFVAWRNENDEIPDEELPMPPNAKRVIDFSRNPTDHYSAALDLAVAGRIYPSHKISLEQSHIARDYFNEYCQTLLRIGVTLRPNNHFSTHLADEVISRYGPIPGTWLFPFERYNGFLERVSLNGHGGGEMELTLMRHWVRSHLVYEYLLHLPDDAHSKEREKLLEIIRDDSKTRGSLLTQLAVAASEDSGEHINVPKKSTPFNVHRFTVQHPSLYPLLLSHAQRTWPDLDIISEASTEEGTLFLADSAVHSYPYVRRSGIRYSSSTNTRSVADRIALARINGKLVPINIVHILKLSVPGAQPNVCLVIQRLASDSDMPIFPWDIVADELGIYNCYAERYQELEVVSATALDSPVAVIPVKPHRIDEEIWVCISLDRTGYELEDTDVQEEA